VRIQPAIARLLCMACASVVLILCPLGVFADANEDRLVRAIELFDQGQYTAAQEQLLKIRPDDLNEENRALRDAYVDRTRVAITMVEKAEFDFDRADDAIAREHFATARAALNDVLQNEYATKAQRDDARQRLEDIADLTGTTMENVDRGRQDDFGDHGARSHTAPDARACHDDDGDHAAGRGGAAAAPPGANAGNHGARSATARCRDY
jgi:hypothetical protein